MKRKQQSSQTMFMRVQSLFAQAPPIILNQISGAASSISTFSTNVNLIATNHAIQSQDMTGETEVKVADRSQMVKAAIDCAKRGKSYGLATNKPNVVKEVSKPNYWYKDASDLTVATQCKNVYNVLLPLLGAMSGYGLTSAKLANLSARIAAFFQIMNTPRENANDKKTATQNIVNLITENKALLLVIDSAVDTIEESQPDFWRAYQKSRKIVKPARRPIALRILATTEHGAPLANVKVTVTQESTGLTRKTSQKGSSNIQNLTSGTYRAFFHKPGFLNLEIDVNIVSGERTDITVIMMPVQVTS